MQNPIKSFLKFLYCMEVSPQFFSNIQKVNPAVTNLTEFLDSKEYKKKFWKTRIERINCQDYSGKLSLDKDEEPYKLIIEYEASKLIGIIEKISKSQITYMRIYITIHDDKSNCQYKYRK